MKKIKIENWEKGIRYTPSGWKIYILRNPNGKYLEVMNTKEFDDFLKSEKEKLIHDHEILINTILDTKNEEICQEKKIAKEIIKKLAEEFEVEEKQIRIALKDLKKEV